VLTYSDGKLEKAVTRGNGEVGEVITNNAKVFVNLPVNIPFKGTVVLRGEAYITYSDFEKINEKLPELDAKYKNPRNLCSGSVRQLNNQVTAERNVNFRAFSLANTEGLEFKKRKEQMIWIGEQGFDIVENVKVTAEILADEVEKFAKKIPEQDVPSDGLVLIYDDIAYGKSLGATAKFPRDAMAFKWRDEIKNTHLIQIEWSPSRTGLINPVAIFEPVELEGTTVSRASVHNVSILRELKLGTGDEIAVYKANMIIPQIAENLSRTEKMEIPDKCPACGGNAELKKETDVEVLYCMNPDCPAKKIKSFSLFASRDAMNIDGLSESTIEKLAGHGFIKEPADFFRLKKYEEEIISIEGLGEKSFNKLLEAADAARNSTAARLLYGLGIMGIGSANAKMISKYCGGDWNKIAVMTKDELMEIDGVGEVLAKSFADWFANDLNRKMTESILEEVKLEAPIQLNEQIFQGKIFVITGILNHFENRSALKEFIEEMGGKVSGSVSNKTSYLINNDATSSSSKNKKAKEAGVPVITEQEFLDIFELGE